MPAKLSDLEDALLFTGDEAKAFISIKTGEIYYISDYIDEKEHELPDDIYDSDEYIEIPDKRSLNLGRRLAIDFAEEQMPDFYHKIREIFSRSGAFARFKDLLEYNDKLQDWYDYEAKATTRALIDWCKSESITLEPDEE